MGKDSLKSLFLDFYGKQVLTLKDPYNFGFKAPLTKENINDVLFDILDVDKVNKINNIGWIMASVIHDLNKINPDSFNDISEIVLSSRMFGHDLINLMTPFGIKLEWYHKKGGLKNVMDSFKAFVLYRCLINSALFYASEGDKDFLSFIPSTQIQYILTNRYSRNLSLDFNVLNFPKKISTNDIALIYQPFKNSTGYGANTKIEIILDVNENYKILTVKDDGLGLFNKKEGHLLSKQEIENIFNTKRFGMKFCYELTNFLGGFIEVISKCLEEEVVRFSTKDSSLNISNISDHVGTQFRFYLPK